MIVVWGVNPATSGIHLMPFLKEARERGTKLVVIDPRVTVLARQADLFLQPRPGTDLAIALAFHRFLFEEGGADAAFLAAHTTGADRLREKASAWTFERAADVSGVPADLPARLCRALRPHLAGAGQVRVGAGAQPQRRQRRRGHPRAAGRRRQVRRPRRRLLDEQLRLLEPQSHLGRRSGAADARRST